MKREETLKDIFKGADENEQRLIAPLLEEVIYLEEQMKYLRTLPQIKVHAENKAIQKKTEAAKLYKEYSQSYMNAIRILCSIIRKAESSAQDELLKRLEEFSL